MNADQLIEMLTKALRPLAAMGGGDEAIDRETERAREALAAAAEYAKAHVPMCAHCRKNPATCLGRYEDDGPPEYACSECCGHGNEDGYCDPVTAGAAPEPVPHAPDCRRNNCLMYPEGCVTCACTCGALDRAKLLRDVKAITDGDES